MTLLISLLSLFVLTTSCFGDDAYTDVIPEITFTENTPVEQTVYADETDAAHSISFETNYMWRVEVNDVSTRNLENHTDWLRLDQYGGGRGVFNLKITTEPNETGIDRTAEIVIDCGNKTTFTVIQKGTKRND